MNKFESIKVDNVLSLTDEAVMITFDTSYQTVLNIIQVNILLSNKIFLERKLGELIQFVHL